jgi:hypothetical protein
MAAACPFCTMPETNSPRLDFIGASLVAASFHLRAMPDTNSSNPGIVGTPLVAASLHQCTMPLTYSPLYGSIGASLVAASFHHCAMSDTNSTLNGSIGTSVVLTKCFFSTTAAFLLFLPYLRRPFIAERRVISFVIPIVIIGGGHIFQPSPTTHFLVGWPERRHHRLPLFS